MSPVFILDTLAVTSFRNKERDVSGITGSMKRRTGIFMCLIVSTATANAPMKPESLSVAPDVRTPIPLAPARRANWGCLMRGHLNTLVEAIADLSAGKYEQAAEVTENNFGLAVGTAEYCRESLFTKEGSIAAAKLPPQPPEPVRVMFAQMQAAAGSFARAARQAASSGDPSGAWQSLAELGATCSGCHAAYRLP